MGGRVISTSPAALNPAGLRFWLEYQPSAGGWRRAFLPECCVERFEDALPVRRFHFEKGLGSFAGWWYFNTTGTHVGFESWLERDHLMLMDFDPTVQAVSSQPFWLRWHDEEDKARRHAPDYFVRRSDGAATVVDVRPDDRIPKRDAGVFAVTAAACAVAGWEYRRVGELDPALVSNVRWLSRYRHARCLVPEIAEALVEAFSKARGLFDGAAVVGERLHTLPVLFHLMWQGRLVANLIGGPRPPDIGPLPSA